MKLIKNIVINCNELYSRKLIQNLVSQLNTNERKAFDAIRVKPDITDSELVEIIYPGRGPSNTTYQNLKGTLREKLLTLEIISVNGNPIQRQKKRIYKKQLLVRSLELRGFKPGVYLMSKKCLKDALNYQMYDVAMDMCRLLSNYFNMYDIKPEKALSYWQDSQNFMELYKNEMIAESNYGIAISLANKRRTISSSYADKVKDLCESIKLDKDSHRLHYYYYMMRIIEFEFRGLTDKKIEICREALNYFDRLYFRHNDILTIFRNRLISCYIHSNKLGLAETLVHSELTQEDKTAYQKIVFLHKLAWIQTRMNRYEEALSNLNKIEFSKITVPGMKIMYTIDKLYLLLATNRHKEVNIRKLKIGLPSIKKDLSGFGLTFMIAEYLYYIQSGRRYKLEDDEKYIESYIKDNLDEIVHARQINLLYLMMGKQTFLDETNSPEAEDSEMMPFGHIKVLIEKYAKV